MITGILFIIALIAAVALFWYVSTSSYAGDNLQKLEEQIIDAKESVQSVGDAVSTATTATETPYAIPSGGVPLSSLPLTDQQKNALKGVGIDVSTFVLTEAMLACGAEKIGGDRIEAIRGGGAPTFMETTQLLPCLTAR